LLGLSLGGCDPQPDIGYQGEPLFDLRVLLTDASGAAPLASEPGLSVTIAWSAETPEGPRLQKLGAVTATSLPASIQVPLYDRPPPSVGFRIQTAQGPNWYAYGMVFLMRTDAVGPDQRGFIGPETAYGTNGSINLLYLDKDFDQKGSWARGFGGNYKAGYHLLKGDGVNGDQALPPTTEVPIVVRRVMTATPQL
jgi:hypothetical protein